MMAKHVRVINVVSANWARMAHLLGAYWGFALCGVHAGLHMTGLLRRWKRIENRTVKIAIALAALAAVAYGVAAFVKRGLPGYMSLRQQFVFFDYSEPLIFFFIDYAFILLAYMAAGCGHGYGLQGIGRRKRA